MSIDVPPVVRNKARAHGAERWLDTLPDLIRQYERSWGITVGRAYADPTEAYVAEATMADGAQAVLKLIVPRDGNAARNEIVVLRLAAGDGCARLLLDDEANGALLLERLGPSLVQLGLPIERRHEILADTASRLWRPAPDCGLPTGAAKGAWLMNAIATGWERMGRPCAERTIDHALACAQRRITAHDDERAVLVHGDVHQWNVLQSADGFKLVDPDGLLAEAEYDLGIIMREDPDDAMVGDARERSRWLAARTGRNEVAIWEWGVVERVSTGLLSMEIGLEPTGGQMLAVADRVAVQDV